MMVCTIEDSRGFSGERCDLFCSRGGLYLLCSKQIRKRDGKREKSYIHGCMSLMLTRGCPYYDGPCCGFRQ